jgi:anti-sigma factor RsiW
MGGVQIGEEALERYSLGRLTEDEAGPVEEHLLICASCRKRLEQLDAYHRAMRSALSKIEQWAYYKGVC